MEPEFEEYCNVLKTFYATVTKKHPSYFSLKSDFGKMVIGMSRDDALSMLGKSIGIKHRR